MRPIRPASPRDVLAIAHAVTLLAEARSCLCRAGAPRAHAAAQRALKSAEGAQRHVCHRLARTAA